MRKTVGAYIGVGEMRIKYTVLHNRIAHNLIQTAQKAGINSPERHEHGTKQNFRILVVSHLFLILPY